jgi:hypothetical protein
LKYNGETYKDIIEQLGGKNGNGTCHLDPDIRQGIYDTPKEFKPAFGQNGIPQMTLKKQGVGVGDLFLFFGLFKQIERGVDGKLRYVPKAPDLHIIYGYMQIGAVLTDNTEIQAYSWHPHAGIVGNNNCLYIPSKTLSWNNEEGYGVFSYDKRLVLTKEGMSCSRWILPDFFRTANNGKPIKITGSADNPWHTDPIHGAYLQIAHKPSQEFVIEERPDVEEWAKKIVL